MSSGPTKYETLIKEYNEAAGHCLQAKLAFKQNPTPAGWNSWERASNRLNRIKREMKKEGVTIP